MNVLLFDDNVSDNLLPLTFTRPVSELRIGILKIREKWEKYLNQSEFSYLTREYLTEKYPAKIHDRNLLVNSALVPDKKLVRTIEGLKQGQALVKEDRLLACVLEGGKISTFDPVKTKFDDIVIYFEEAFFLNFPWEIFQHNGNEIRKDFELITRNRQSQSLSDNCNILGNELFVEEGVKAEFVTINTTSGPVYLGKDSELMEGSVIRGPFALCSNSTVKLSAKIYGPTTIGPDSKVGGEINNSVIQGYSNKAHDGFLGNSVIGEWCNIGADTNNSNLKNNYAEVKLWSYVEDKFINTGLQFCGLIMGDHSKCGINTMFNTGTVVGVNANIFGSGFPRNFVPSFSWGGSHGLTTYSISKAFEVASLVMERRGIEFDDTEKNILKNVFKQTEKNRK